MICSCSFLPFVILQFRSVKARLPAELNPFKDQIRPDMTLRKHGRDYIAESGYRGPLRSLIHVYKSMVVIYGCSQSVAIWKLDLGMYVHYIVHGVVYIYYIVHGVVYISA